MKKYVLPKNFEEDMSTKNLLTEEDIQDLEDRYENFMKNPESRSKEERDYLIDKAYEYRDLMELTNVHYDSLKAMCYWLSRPQKIEHGLVEPEPTKKYRNIIKNWLGL